MKPGKTRRKVIEGNADAIIRQITRQKPAAYRQCSGGARNKRRYGKTNHRQGPPAYRQRGGGGETERCRPADDAICEVTGWRHRVSPRRSAYSSPWWLLTLSLRRRRREAALLFPESSWYMTTWDSRPSLFMVIPNTKRHPNNKKTGQLHISGVITGLPRPYLHIGEFIGFIIAFRCFPTQQNLVCRKTPYEYKYSQAVVYVSLVASYKRPKFRNEAHIILLLFHLPSDNVQRLYQST